MNYICELHECRQEDLHFDSTAERESDYRTDIKFVSLTHIYSLSLSLSHMHTLMHTDTRQSATASSQK